MLSVSSRYYHEAGKASKLTLALKHPPCSNPIRFPEDSTPIGELSKRSSAMEFHYRCQIVPSSYRILQDEASNNVHDLLPSDVDVVSSISLNCSVASMMLPLYSFVFATLLLWNLITADVCSSIYILNRRGAICGLHL